MLKRSMIIIRKVWSKSVTLIICFFLTLTGVAAELAKTESVLLFLETSWGIFESKVPHRASD